MGEQDSVAVIGAGVVGCAIAWSLAREGWPVMLADPAEPGAGGASFGNAGHLGAELVEPLPSPALLFGFWRQLFVFGGALDIPWRRLPQFAPWAWRFAAAAFRQRANTRQFAPLVRPAAAAWERTLREVGSRALLRRNGHHQVWLTPGHVLDPRGVCEALARAAVARGASVRRLRVLELAPRGDRIELRTDAGTLTVSAAIVCAGVWSTPLLTHFGLHAPLEAVRGYHVELPGHAPLADAPVVYMDDDIVVTPLASRLRATSYMEFSVPEAAPDPRKPARLAATLRRLGYRCDSGNSGWVGPRPVLPDYLPGIGRVPGGARVFYAIGHHHLGLTLAPVTAELIVALVAGREPEHDVRGFDLRRFG
ncbi:MAG: FAD-binding oxidoreductase [Gammaproteobacteria bacterium]|nr:MAG: FAD-binding oxidoreductase [Gammaproteobacteria bacterium]